MTLSAMVPLVVAFTACSGGTAVDGVPPQPIHAGPLTSPPFLAAAVVVSGVDHDRAVDRVRGFAPTVRVRDQSTTWSWDVPPGTPILAVADGKIASVENAEPWSCGGQSGVESTIREVIDGTDLAVGYAGAEPSVSSGTVVRAGDIIARTAPEHHCGSSLAMVVWRLGDTEVRLDPFDPSEPLFALSPEQEQALTGSNPGSR